MRAHLNLRFQICTSFGRLSEVWSKEQYFKSINIGFCLCYIISAVAYFKILRKSNLPWQLTFLKFLFNFSPRLSFGGRFPIEKESNLPAFTYNRSFTHPCGLPTVSTCKDVMFGHAWQDPTMQCKWVIAHSFYFILQTPPPHIDIINSKGVFFIMFSSFTDGSKNVQSPRHRIVVLDLFVFKFFQSSKITKKGLVLIKKK